MISSALIWRKGNILQNYRASGWANYLRSFGKGFRQREMFKRPVLTIFDIRIFEHPISPVPRWNRDYRNADMRNVPEWGSLKSASSAN